MTRLVQKSKAKHFCLMNLAGMRQLNSTAGLKAVQPTTVYRVLTNCLRSPGRYFMAHLGHSATSPAIVEDEVTVIDADDRSDAHVGGQRHQVGNFAGGGPMRRAADRWPQRRGQARPDLNAQDGLIVATVRTGELHGPPPAALNGCFGSSGKPSSRARLLARARQPADTRVPDYAFLLLAKHRARSGKLPS